METGAKKRKKESKGSQYDTLWDRLFALYALPPVDHPDIDRELAWFANHPAYLERAQNRAEPFLYSIVKLIEKKNIPGELALLPIVESAFQPNVVSSARAAGIWQFIPSTGSNYGLKRSRFYDGRRDVYASTKAAIKYLRKLHGDFGDWLLAIAAYNCGEGAVGRAIRRNEAEGLPTDFWSLNLPQETRAYVPKLLAVARLFADAEKYGISLKDLPNMAKYKPVKVSNQLDLALAADAAGISLDKLYELNPGFRGQYADVDGSYHLYIPADKKAAEFRQEVERLSMQRGAYAPREPMVSREPMPTEPNAFETFRREFERRPPPRRPLAEDSQGSLPLAEPAARADTAPAPEPRVATRYRPVERSAPVEEVTVEPRTVVNLNPPRKGRAAPPMETGRNLAAADEAPVVKSSYSVQPGETLHSVARKYSVGVSQLAQWNNFPVTTRIQAGQKLLVTEPPGKTSGSKSERMATRSGGRPVKLTLAQASREEAPKRSAESSASRAGARTAKSAHVSVDSKKTVTKSRR